MVAKWWVLAWLVLLVAGAQAETSDWSKVVRLRSSATVLVVTGGYHVDRCRLIDADDSALRCATDAGIRLVFAKAQVDGVYHITHRFVFGTVLLGTFVVSCLVTELAPNPVTGAACLGSLLVGFFYFIYTAAEDFGRVVTGRTPPVRNSEKETPVYLRTVIAQP